MSWDTEIGYLEFKGKKVLDEILLYCDKDESKGDNSYIFYEGDYINKVNKKEGLDREIDIYFDGTTQECTITEWLSIFDMDNLCKAISNRHKDVFVTYTFISEYESRSDFHKSIEGYCNGEIQWKKEVDIVYYNSDYCPLSLSDGEE